jgi:hypothetical protein
MKPQDRGSGGGRNIDAKGEVSVCADGQLRWHEHSNYDRLADNIDNGAVCCRVTSEMRDAARFGELEGPISAPTAHGRPIHSQHEIGDAAGFREVPMSAHGWPIHARGDQ